MNEEYEVVILGRLDRIGWWEKVRATIKTKATSAQAAILQVAGISPQALVWDSVTFRLPLGYLDNVTVFSYEVEQKN